MSPTTPIWFITGAGSGFGRNIALEALSSGHKVIATARTVAKLTDLRDAGAAVFTLDVTASDEDITSVVSQAYAIYGGITHFVNAAGYMVEGMVEETSTKEISDLLNTNVVGSVNMLRAILPAIRKTNTSYPKVVALFGSSMSWTAFPSCGIYCASKWAVSGLTEALIGEVGLFGIKAVVIEPGIFKTDMLDRGRVTTEKRLNEYKALRDTIHASMNETAKLLMGDTAKGAKVIVDVLSSNKIPMRLILGSDALATIERKCDDTKRLLQDWSETIKSTDFEKQ